MPRNLDLEFSEDEAKMRRKVPNQRDAKIIVFLDTTAKCTSYLT